MQQLLRHLLPIFHCRLHCAACPDNPDNMVVLQLRSGDHRERVFVGHCLALNCAPTKSAEASGQVDPGGCPASLCS
eukprot:4531193-Lingulodinium_polyedra.AAC.1